MSTTGKRCSTDELTGPYRKKVYTIRVGRSKSPRSRSPRSPTPRSPTSRSPSPRSPTSRSPTPRSLSPELNSPPKTHPAPNLVPAPNPVPAKVTFTERSYLTRPIPIPSAKDDLPAISSKLAAIMIELATDRSVAIATDTLTRAKLAYLDPMGAAKRNMSDIESRFWNIFQEQPDTIRQKFPVLDWQSCKLAVGEKSTKRFQRRALALNALYETDNIDSENAKWFTLHHESKLPLVKAIDRMQAAERITTLSREETYDALVKIEVNCLLRIVSVSRELLNKRIQELQDQGESIARSFRVTAQRGDAMAWMIRKFDEIEAAGETVLRNPLCVAEVRAVMCILKVGAKVVERCEQETVDNFTSISKVLLRICSRVDQLVPR